MFIIFKTICLLDNNNRNAGCVFVKVMFSLGGHNYTLNAARHPSTYLHHHCLKQTQPPPHLFLVF